MRPHPRLALMGAIALAAAVAAGCTASPAPAPTPSPTPTATPSPTPSPTPTPTPTPSPTPTPTPTPELLSPLTGLPYDGPAPVLIVKLDNTHNALPHAGLDKADLVFVEEVEYGITRIAAVFSSKVPKRIGPVRSARITDIDLVPMFGKPAFGYSGAQHKMFPVLDDASIYDVSPRFGAEGYTRDSSRYAPYNYFLDGHIALDRAPKASDSTDIGLVFDATPPPGGLVANKASMRWGYASAGFRYDPETGLYDVSLNDRPATAEGRKHGQQAANVVIQYVKQSVSPFYDKGGGNTPHAHLIGEGTGMVLRDGLAYDVTWSRPAADSPTIFTMADGTVMPFKPGQSWFMLLDKKRTAVVKPLTVPSPSPTPIPSSTATASSTTSQSPTSTASTTPTGLASTP